jgi:hypothetical protein
VRNSGAVQNNRTKVPFRLGVLAVAGVGLLALGCPEGNSLTGPPATTPPLETATPAPTAAHASTRTPVFTSSPAHTAAAPPTATPPSTGAPTITPTRAHTATGVATRRPSETATRTAIPTGTPTGTRTPSPTGTSIPTRTASRTNTPTTTSTPVPTLTPTATATPPPTGTPGPLVYASGEVRVFLHWPPSDGEGTIVKVEGVGIFAITVAGQGGLFQLPPFAANVPIVLTCSKPGHVVVAKYPPDNYAPPPGTYTNWGCTLLDRRIPP